MVGRGVVEGSEVGTGGGRETDGVCSIMKRASLKVEKADWRHH
jgi:hypothetical protein